MGLCAALLGQVAPLGAQSDDENARRHFESGAAYLQQSDNENALREFQAAYSLSKRPALLLNIANVYERMGKPKEAVETLTKYLEDPKTTDRTTVETRIANLKKRVESGDTTPPPAASASAAPAFSAAPVTSSAPPIVETPKPTRSPNRTPAYIALGVGGASAVGALITGLVAKSKFDNATHDCKPSCPDSTVNSIKTVALVSTILTGVAVVSVGVGGVLFFTAKPPASDAASAGPSLNAGLGPGGGKVEATWRF